jgi:hypothetical protein
MMKSTYQAYQELKDDKSSPTKASYEVLPDNVSKHAKDLQSRYEKVTSVCLELGYKSRGEDAIIILKPLKSDKSKITTLELRSDINYSDMNYYYTAKIIIPILDFLKLHNNTITTLFVDPTELCSPEIAQLRLLELSRDKKIEITFARENLYSAFTSKEGRVTTCLTRHSLDSIKSMNSKYTTLLLDTWHLVAILDFTSKDLQPIFKFLKSPDNKITKLTVCYNRLIKAPEMQVLKDLGRYSKLEIDFQAEASHLPDSHGLKDMLQKLIEVLEIDLTQPINNQLLNLNHKKPNHCKSKITTLNLILPERQDKHNSNTNNQDITLVVKTLESPDNTITKLKIKICDFDYNKQIISKLIGSLKSANNKITNLTINSHDYTEDQEFLNELCVLNMYHNLEVGFDGYHHMQSRFTKEIKAPNKLEEYHLKMMTFLLLTNTRLANNNQTGNTLANIGDMVETICKIYQESILQDKDIAAHREEPSFIEFAKRTFPNTDSRDNISPANDASPSYSAPNTSTRATGVLNLLTDIIKKCWPCCKS